MMSLGRILWEMSWRVLEPGRVQNSGELTSPIDLVNWIERQETQRVWYKNINGDVVCICTCIVYIFMAHAYFLVLLLNRVKIEFSKSYYCGVSTVFSGTLFTLQCYMLHVLSNNSKLRIDATNPNPKPTCCWLIILSASMYTVQIKWRTPSNKVTVFSVHFRIKKHAYLEMLVAFSYLVAFLFFYFVFILLPTVLDKDMRNAHQYNVFWRTRD